MASQPSPRGVWHRWLDQGADGRVSRLAIRIAKAADRDRGWPDWDQLARQYDVTETELFDAFAELEGEGICSADDDGRVFRRYVAALIAVDPLGLQNRKTTLTC